jgi:hypothetical protein
MYMYYGTGMKLMKRIEALEEQTKTKLVYVVVEVGSGRVCQVFKDEERAVEYIGDDKIFYNLFKKALVY